MFDSASVNSISSMPVRYQAGWVGMREWNCFHLQPSEKAGRIQVIPFGRRIWLRPAFRLWPTLLGIGTMAVAAAALAKALAAGCRGATAVGREN